jgi:hypothetical protein
MQLLLVLVDPLLRATDCTKCLTYFPLWQSTIASFFFYTSLALDGIQNTSKDGLIYQLVGK